MATVLTIPTQKKIEHFVLNFIPNDCETDQPGSDVLQTFSSYPGAVAVTGSKENFNGNDNTCG